MKKSNDVFDDYYDVYEENWTHDTFGELEYTQSLEKNIRKKLNKEDSKQNLFFCTHDKTKINNSNEVKLNKSDIVEKTNEVNKKFIDNEKINASFKFNSKIESDKENVDKNKLENNLHRKSDKIYREKMDNQIINKLDKEKRIDQELYLFKDIYEELEKSKNDSKENYSYDEGSSKRNNHHFLENLEFISSNNESESAEVHSSNLFNIDDSAMSIWDGLNDNDNEKYSYGNDIYDNDNFDKRFSNNEYGNIEHNDQEHDDKECDDKEKDDKEEDDKEEDDKEEDDKEEDDKTQNNKTQNDKTQNNKTQNDKKQNDKKQNDKKQNDKKQDDKVHAHKEYINNEQTDNAHSRYKGSSLSISKNKYNKDIEDKEYYLKPSSSFSNFLKENLDINADDEDDDILNYLKKKNNNLEDKSINLHDELDNVYDKHVDNERVCDDHVDDDHIDDVHDGDIVSIFSDNLKEDINIHDNHVNIKSNRNFMKKDKSIYTDSCKHHEQSTSCGNNTFLNEHTIPDIDNTHVRNGIINSASYLFNSGYSSMNNANFVDNNAYSSVNNNNYVHNGGSYGSLNNGSCVDSHYTYNSRNNKDFVNNNISQNINNIDCLDKTTNSFLNNTDTIVRNKDAYDSHSDNSLYSNVSNHNKRNKNMSENTNIISLEGIKNNGLGKNSVHESSNINNSISNISDNSTSKVSDNSTSKVSDNSTTHNHEKNTSKKSSNTFFEQKYKNFKFKKKQAKENLCITDEPILSTQDDVTTTRVKRRNTSSSNNKMVKNLSPYKNNKCAYSENKENKKNVFVRSIKQDDSSSLKRGRDNENVRAVCNSNDSTDIIVDLNDEESWDDIDNTNMIKDDLKTKGIVTILRERLKKSKINSENRATEKGLSGKSVSEKGALVKSVTQKGPNRNNNSEKTGTGKRDLNYEKTEECKDSDKLKELGDELRNQINKLEKEQGKVKKLEYELIAKSAEMELEREEMKNKMEEEKNKMMKTIEEEKKKWNKEKKRIENEVDKQRNIIMNKRKLTNEIAMFKNKIKELEEKLETEKKHHKVVVDNLKKKVENLKKENEKLRTELKISDEYRNKLENYQQKTIMKLATTVVNEKKLNKHFGHSDSEEYHYNAPSDIHLMEDKDTMDTLCTPNNKQLQKHNRNVRLGEKNKKKSLQYTDKIEQYKHSSDSESSNEIKKIIYDKNKKMQNELDIIYESSNSDNKKYYKNELQKDDSGINISNDNFKKNEKKRNKVTLDKLFAVHKEDTKSSSSVLKDEAYINKNLNKMKSIIQKNNNNRLSSDKLKNEEENSSLTASEHVKNSKEFFFENIKKANDKYSKQIRITYNDHAEQSNQNEYGKMTSYLNNYTTNSRKEKEKIKKVKNSNQMFDNLNKNISSGNSSTKDEDVKGNHYLNDPKRESISRNKNDNIASTLLKYKKNQKTSNCNVINTSKEVEKNTHNEYPINISKIGREMRINTNRNCLNSNLTYDMLSKHQGGEDNYPPDASNHVYNSKNQNNDASGTIRNTLERGNVSKKNGIYNNNNSNNNGNNNSNSKDSSNNCLNPFGKNWSFIMNFNFDELFNICENVIESIFSSSKKIKYRQAFIDGKVETLFDDGLKIIEKNRNKKIIDPSNLTIYLYPSKDYKAKLPNSYTLFRFVNKGIYQVNIPNKCQLNKFPSGQIDCKYSDGHMQILFCDGKRKEILPNKEEYTILRNGKIKKLN
ncbi:spindle assembly abnormal protein 4, putative [Plasmodium malariae]|uniref:Spindle assembly abnormal protein 4, putative n=1 Tax=Plasmodium malariae TaxID=5858 RepID=A0A1C3L1D1_PLAMA|nr:spindle assembly abnormal protein 4, putative [Plasmodium malariae]